MHNFFLKCLIIANSSSYAGKQEFYQFKNKFLETYGRYDGKDVQIIKRSCNACDGTGIYGYWFDNGGEWCYRCNGTGIYDTNTYYLERYFIDQYLFHVPTFKEPVFGELRNTIKGKITHKNYGRHAGEIAFKFLLFWYDREFMLRIIKEKTISKYKFRKAQIKLWLHNVKEYWKHPYVIVNGDFKIYRDVNNFIFAEQEYKIFRIKFEENYRQKRHINWRDGEIWWGFGFGSIVMRKEQESVDVEEYCNELDLNYEEIIEDLDGLPF